MPIGENPQARRLEVFWRHGLSRLYDHLQVREVRIRGSIAAVELKADGGYLADIGRELRCRCLQAGVMLRPLGNVLYALPPLNTPDESLARIATAMIDAIGGAVSR